MADTDKARLDFFSRAVRKRRVELGLTQAELAEAAGLHRKTVSRIERGEHVVSMLAAADLARALKFDSIDMLLPVTRIISYCPTCQRPY
jgi:transcriptional regulator with XRE-family HTH domain